MFLVLFWVGLVQHERLEKLTSCIFNKGKEKICLSAVAMYLLAVLQYFYGKGWSVVIHSLLSFELFDNASLYSCVLLQELDLNMLHSEMW